MILQIYTALTGSSIDEPFWVHDGALAGGYGEFDMDSLRLIGRLAKDHGVLFDPVYTLKAYVGLAQLCASGAVPKGSKVALLHSGGASALGGLLQSAAVDYRGALVRELVRGEGP